MLLEPGNVIANRFRVDKRAGVGGMGIVYRAIDETTQKPVALKILLSNDSDDLERFEREASVVSSLAHPGIVTPIDRGALPTGEPFLILEWLEGNDLAARLKRGPLSVSDTLTLIRATTSALAAAHGAGIVHRDIKPANLFLRGDQVEAVTLLDFGIARRMGTGKQLTHTGAALGTPQYMAPEQATGNASAGPAADIFSLGCVLFECLSGGPPFDGTHPLAVLTKIILEEAPPLRSKVPTIDPALDELCARMLEKDPGARIPNATALLAAIDALDCTVPHSRRQSLPPSHLTGLEHEIICVIVVQRAREAITMDSTRLSPITTTLTSLGVRTQTLADGTMIATLTGLGQAMDQVARAARSALLLLERFPEAAVSMAMGRVKVGARKGMPVGEAIDRAFRIGIGIEAPTKAVVVDDVTAGLLGDRFIIEAGPSGQALLRRERVHADHSRLLLGRPTPCVGRERELGRLQSAWEECVSEQEAQAFLVLAPPGIGKSRLRHELTRRLAQRGERYHELVARGDPLISSALGLIPRALRVAFGVEAHEPLDAQREAVQSWIAQHLPTAASSRLVERLGELSGVPFPDEESPKLRMARQDPRFLAEQMTQAFVDLCRALSADAPLLLLLEDLHWADAFSIELVGAALRELSEQPMFVLALARPEVRELFPRLWGDRAEQMVLQPLRPRAAEQLAATMLGDRAGPQDIKRVVDLAAGNALFLEELIRTVAEGRGDDLPETVLAVLQARIGRLKPELRRTLRAASVFGLVCSEAGVAHLLGPDAQAKLCLETLVEEEALERRRQADLHSEIEYVFRHALVREAAYGLLLPEDQALGHQLAADYLTRIQGDPAEIADHYHRGGADTLAIPYWARAAEQALKRNDIAAVVRYTELGEAAGAVGFDLGMLLAIRAPALRGAQGFVQSFQDAMRAASLLPEGHPLWCRAIGHEAAVHILRGHREEGRATVDRVLRVVPQEAATFNHAMSLWGIVGTSAQVGQMEQAKRALARLKEIAEPSLHSMPLLEAWIGSAEYELLRHTRPDPFTQAALLRRAIQLAEDADIGLHHELVVFGNYLALSDAELGDQAKAAELFRTNMGSAHARSGLFLLSHTRLHFAEALHQRTPEPPVEEVLEHANAVLAWEGASPGFRAMARAFVAWAELCRGNLDLARRECEIAIAASGLFPLRKLRMQATLLRILSARGEHVVAYELAAQAIHEMVALGSAGYAEIPLRTAAAQVFEEAGLQERARSTLAEALAQIEKQAASIPDEAARAHLRERVADNARARALGRILGFDT